MKHPPAKRWRFAARPRAASGKRRRGTATLEALSLALPILLSLALLCVDYGRLASCYMAVLNAARAGAGYASANPYTPGTQTAWKAAAVQAGNDEFAADTWCNSGQLTVGDPVVVSEGNGYWYVKVTATYSFQTLINWNWIGLPGYHTPRSLTRTVVMRGTI